MSDETNKPRVLRRSRGRLLEGVQPIVLEYRPRQEEPPSETAERAAEQYSRGLEDIQRAEADLVRVARRATRAVATGLDTYDRERRRSAQEKMDGAIEDFPHNSAKALSESLKEASEIPMDIADSASAVNYRRRVRKQLKRVSKVLRVFRL